MNEAERERLWESGNGGETVKESAGYGKAMRLRNYFVELNVAHKTLLWLFPRKLYF